MNRDCREMSGNPLLHREGMILSDPGSDPVFDERALLKFLKGGL